MKVSTASISTLFQKADSPSEIQDHLLGFRGFLEIESFIWVFLQTFVPVAVKSSKNATGASYEETLRKTLSVLFWNDSFIYSSFILLSARTICIRFLQNPTKTVVASVVFRRGLRLWFPTAAALAIVKIFFSTISTAYVEEFKAWTGNVSFNSPYQLPNAFAYFNSVFNLFWTTRDFFDQAGNTAFPSQTLWIVNVIYSQSYTVYMTMVLVPYTRNSWRIQAYISFIVTAWWVQSWAWYSITGLLVADVITNMEYQERAQRGVKVWQMSKRCPTWIPCLVLIAAGLVMQYLWTAWRPQYGDRELRAHTGLYNSGGLNTEINPNEPQARDDNYLVLLGFFLILEYSSRLQRLFCVRLFFYLGRRSLSWFLVQSIIVYTVGIKVFMRLSAESGLVLWGSRCLCLVVCLISVAIGAEIFYWLVDRPSQAFAHLAYRWIRE